MLPTHPLNVGRSAERSPPCHASMTLCTHGAEQEMVLMVEADNFLQALLDQAAAEEAFFDGLRQPQNGSSNGTAAPLVSAPSVSLMVTNQQRTALRELGFSDEAVRLMTPAEAHEQLGLGKPSV